ncbi:MAG TPA: hypothetical protein VFZ80_06545, partial [Acidimicrobiia bacterium]
MEGFVSKRSELIYARLGAQDFSLSSRSASVSYDSPGDKLATPYFQLRLESVPSTQDVAREQFDRLPLLVIASSQTHGRGRSGVDWENADRALAASLIFEHDEGDHRPFSLMAGVAAVRSTEGTRLKWPNDVLTEEGLKAGGILVERDRATTVIGLGMNLWWPSPPE